MNPNNQRQTYWQQLTQGGINAVLFWALNIVLLSAYFWNRTGNENAPYVLYGALIMQVVNVLGTYFQKENQRLRNLPSFLPLAIISSLDATVLLYVVGVGFFCWLTWHLTRKHYQLKRVTDIESLRGKLQEAYHWNNAEFPQYAAALADLSVQLGEWEKSIEAGSREDWPWQVRGGEQVRADLRSRFEKRAGSFTMTALVFALLAGSLLSCQRNPSATAEARTERPAPDAWTEQHPSDTVSTYTDARQFEVPLASR